MATPLTPNSRIIKAIASHIETGIPITADNYHLSPDDMLRLRAVFALYKAWENNPMVNKQEFLKARGRRSQDLPNDLYCFDYIRNLANELTISRADAEFIMDKYTKKILQAGDDTGDPHLWETGLKLLGKYHKLDKEAPAEAAALNTATLPTVISTDVHHIDKERTNYDRERRIAILREFGGKPDVIEDKIAAKRLALFGNGEGEEETIPLMEFGSPIDIEDNGNEE